MTSHSTSAGRVERTVESGERNGTATRTVVARRRYGTSQADLWDAVTNAERLPRWFLPVSGDLRLGGRYQFEGNAGGVVERCEPPRMVGATWEAMGQVSWVEVRIASEGDGSLLELRHEAPVDPEFWDRYGPGAVGVGWELGLLGLAQHVGDGDAPDDLRATDDWALTPEGTSFVRAAATGWAAAAAADGDDEVAAREAAERTTAFYTVPPEPAGPPASDA